MSQYRFARLAALLAAIGLSTAAPLLAHAADQAKADPAAAAPKQNTIRNDMYKLLDPKVLQPLLDQKQFAQVQENIAKAEAFPDRTPYENYVIDRMKLALASASKNDAAVTAAIERVLASGFATPEESANFSLVLAENAFGDKNYAKAITLWERYLKEVPNPNPAVRSNLIRAYYLNKDYAKAVPALKASIAEAEKAGKTPVEQDLRLLASSAQQVKDQETLMAAMEKTIQYYPTDDAWSMVLSRLLNRPGMEQRVQPPNIFRLARAAMGQMDASWYVELAEDDLSSGFPTEAKQVIDEGFAKGVLGTGPQAGEHKKLRARADKGAAEDVKTIAAGEASASKAKDGVGLVNTGYAYVTMGQTDKGLDLMQKGIAKGMKRADDGKVLLGIAYARAGRKDDAIKTFQSVGGDSITKDTARFWLLYVNGPEFGKAATK
jgi:lipopolysaccharide biosynthesis regulator YciM